LPALFPPHRHRPFPAKALLTPLAPLLRRSGHLVFNVFAGTPVDPGDPFCTEFYFNLRLSRVDIENGNRGVGN
jgi:hypothetical protein